MPQLFPQTWRDAMTDEYWQELCARHKGTGLTYQDQQYVSDMLGSPVTLSTIQRQMNRFYNEKNGIEAIDNAPSTTPPDTDTDLALWRDWLAFCEEKQPLLTVSHACDIHSPYHDPYSLELYYKLLGVIQPDLIVVGSDFADFATLSSFPLDPTMYQDRSVLRGFMRDWQDFIANVISVSPHSKLVWLYGNHEDRIFRHLMSDAQVYSDIVLEKFTEIIRHGGRVWYLGEVDCVRVGYLQIEHGNRHNEHVAKSRLWDLGGQINVMAGHVHRQTHYALHGADYTVQGITSGGLCPTEPHYQQRGRTAQRRRWQQGTAFASMNIRHPHVTFENLLFVNDSTTKYTIARGQEFNVTKRHYSIKGA